MGPPAIDVSAARRAIGEANVWVAPTVDRGQICSTADLPEGNAYVSACAPVAALAASKGQGVFSTSRPSPGVKAAARVVGVVADDVAEVRFTSASGGVVTVKPVANVVVLDAAELPETAAVVHVDGAVAATTFGGER